MGTEARPYFCEGGGKGKGRSAGGNVSISWKKPQSEQLGGKKRGNLVNTGLEQP